MKLDIEKKLEEYEEINRQILENFKKIKYAIDVEIKNWEKVIEQLKRS